VNGLSDADFAGDAIMLKGMVFYGHHGISEAERRDAQKFLVDVTVTYPLQAAARADDLSLTIDYGGLYDMVKSVILGPSVNLLETLAENIAGKALKHYSGAQKVRVRVKKTQPPIKGDLRWAAVDIERGR